MPCVELTSGHIEVVDAELVDETTGTAPAVYTAVRESGDSIPTATNRWLAGKKPNTRDAYLRDLRAWHSFLQEVAVDVLGARKRDADAFAVALGRQGLSEPSRKRRMSGVSAWYKYLIACDLAEHNPFTAAERPKVDSDYSATEWLSEPEAQLLLDTVGELESGTRLRDLAMLTLMLMLGIRVTELLALQIAAISSHGGQRTVRIIGKGGRRINRALPDQAVEAIDDYLQERRAREQRKRLTGHLFVTAAGNPLDRNNFAKSLAHWCKLAGVKQVSPHGLRHTFATVVTERGAGLDELQDAMGHADPRTTRRYQRAARRLVDDPAHRAAAAFAGRRAAPVNPEAE